MIQRDRLSERINLSLLRLELKRATRPLIVLAIGFAVAALAGQYILSHIRGGIGTTHRVHFQVADATGVVPARAEVRFKGIQAGLVTTVDLAHGHPVISADVGTKFGPIYKNATAAVRPNTALQDMYIDITSRGTPSAGQVSSSYVIPMDQTQSSVNVAEVLDAFQPTVRAHLYDVFNQLGNGLQDRGALLRRAFVDLAPLLRIAGQVSQQLAVRADLTKSLVHDTGTLSGVLAERNSQLQNLIVAGSRSLEGLTSRGGADLQATIHELPATLTAIDQSFGALRGVLPDVNQAVTSLYPVADNLPTSLASLRSFSASADPAVRALRTPVQKLVPLSDALRPLASSLGNALGSISPQVPDINAALHSIAGCPQVPYAFFNWTASVTKFEDSQGHYPRGDFGFGIDTLPTTKDPNVVKEQGCSPGYILGGEPTFSEAPAGVKFP
jgi:ABC-type transporter Mla subunit MlaD